MSMILLEPANTILYGYIEDQAADHLINEYLKCTILPQRGFQMEPGNAAVYLGLNRAMQQTGKPRSSAQR
jgi:hypothetical protein